jgi:hypothetical protein
MVSAVKQGGSGCSGSALRHCIRSGAFLCFTIIQLLHLQRWSWYPNHSTKTKTPNLGREQLGNDTNVKEGRPLLSSGCTTAVISASLGIIFGRSGLHGVIFDCGHGMRHHLKNTRLCLRGTARGKSLWWIPDKMDCVQGSCIISHKWEGSVGGSSSIVGVGTAVANGANVVYIGLTLHSARARTLNFNPYLLLLWEGGHRGDIEVFALSNFWMRLEMV